MGLAGSAFKTIAVLPPGGAGWSVRISPDYKGCFFFVDHDPRIKPLMVQPDGNMVILDNAENMLGGGGPVLLPDRFR